jgi:hypothetical protein
MVAVPCTAPIIEAVAMISEAVAMISEAAAMIPEAAAMIAVFGTVTLLAILILAICISPSRESQQTGLRRATKANRRIPFFSDEASALPFTVVMALAGAAGWTIFANKLVGSHWFPGQSLPPSTPLIFAAVLLSTSLCSVLLYELRGAKGLFLAGIFAGIVPLLAGTVLIAANRDERLDREWDPPAAHWPGLIGGRDRLGGGSWMAVNHHGVMAAVLNRVGSLGPEPGKRSRGELPLLALQAASAAEAAARSAAVVLSARPPSSASSPNSVSRSRSASARAVSASASAAAYVKDGRLRALAGLAGEARAASPLPSSVGALLMADFQALAPEEKARLKWKGDKLSSVMRFVGKAIDGKVRVGTQWHVGAEWKPKSFLAAYPGY